MDWLPDVSEASSWALVGNTSLTQTQRRVAIAPQEFALPGAIALVDCQCFEAPESWSLAGWASIILVDAAFRAIVARETVSLRESALVIAPKSSGVYRLKVEFPRWLPSARLIVKSYIGSDIRPTDQLYRIEQKIDAQTFN